MQNYKSISTIMKPNLNFVLTVCLLSLTTIINTGCPEVYDPNIDIYYANKSNMDIFICSVINQSGNECPPDTLLPKKKVGVELKSGETYYGESFAKPECETMRFFILSLDTVNKYNWDYIREKNMILKRYDIVGEAELKAIHWTISYP